MPRYVILTHDHPHWHWDFMLEHEGALRTWRLDEEPGTSAHIRATVLPNHRVMYLDYEGPVSNNRGTVQRWDHGTYELQHEDSLALKLRLHGERLQGVVTMTTDAEGMVWYQYDPQSSDPAG
jgi:hypothetical protein